MKNTEIDWGAVAHHLRLDATGIRDRAQSVFPNELAPQQEMKTRACILESLSEAILFGLIRETKT